MIEALDNLNVPFVIVSRLAPVGGVAAVGALVVISRVTSKIAAVPEPLFVTMAKKSHVGPLPETVPFDLPKKVVVTPAVVFKSNVPSTVRLPEASELLLPPMVRTWFVNEPLPALKTAPAVTVTLPFTANVLAGVDMYSRFPLVP